MTIDEVRELLPSYAAGTLEDGDRKLVEEALKNSAELREELKFWRHAKAATVLHSDIGSKAHLTAEQIVDYANDDVESGPLRLHIENHLQSCTTCRKEYDIIKEMQPERPRASIATNLKHQASSFLFPGFKPVVLLLSLAFLVTILVLVFTREPQPRQAVNEPPKDSLITPPKKEPTKRNVAIVFPYVGSVRDPGEKRKAIPTLTIEEGIDSVHIVLPVQHSALASGYRVQILSPIRKIIGTDTVIASVSTHGIDSVKVSIAASSLNRTGNYFVEIKELMKRRFPDVEPEKYRYEFEVRPASN